ncbi:MAG: NAD(P)-dependent glycerol-3-phosphate dehydrogenase [Candidatus Midichloriaceae bacterium]|jgi:glycerol-3-phosphate dehydrogenase (NAD(P)+)|nr:NAD(P)-dependent glycerol-3-phosphate dehydrogenase [Candidatus Midichloriaceae bacterium]
MHNVAQQLSFGIIGAGAWGSAFAKLAAINGNEVLLWDRSSEVVEKINYEQKFKAVKSLEELKNCEVIVIALPFQIIRNFLGSNLMHPLQNKTFLLLSKGIEISTHALGHQIFSDAKIANSFAVLSGPNFASEIINSLPAAAVVASENEDLTIALKNSLMSGTMRIYKSSDVTGVEVCGAVKNVIAIAAGIATGAAYGENAKSALICRSLVEIENLVCELGGAKETVFGLSGIGDLVLTCGSSTSRNFALGFAIGKQGYLGDLLKDNPKTIEGVSTAKAIKEIATERKISMPICEEVYQILFNNKKVSDSLKSLMTRA